MILTYDSEANIFKLESAYEDREIPKAANFIWNRLVEKHWATQDLSKARMLAQYADSACQVVLKAALEKQAAILELSSATSADLSIPAPDGLEYYGFQKAGVAFALEKKRVLIADEMGLGKTIQVIGVINALQTIRKVLIITKASLRLNWLGEVRRWLTRSLSVELAYSAIWPVADIIIINYDILVRHKAQIDAVDWDLLVMDESHLIKNPKAQRTAMVLGRVPKKPDEPKVSAIRARYAIATTGSPIENSPIEIFGILRYLDARSWPSFWSFVQRYCDAHNDGYGWDFSGASNKEELQRKLRETVMIRRLKRDVLKDLPEKQYQVIEIPVEDSGLKKFLAEELSEWNRKTAELQTLREAVKAAKLAGNEDAYRQLVAALAEGLKVKFEEFSEKRHETGVRKLPYVIDYLQEIMEEEPHKALVFGHHRDVLERLHREFKNSLLIHGGIQPDKRQAIVDRFQTDESVGLFFGSIGAAGAGLNMTAASHVIFVEEDVVPERIRQAEDRAHRIGQKNSVLVTHLVLEGSLDAHLAKIAAGKAANIEVILGTNNSQFELIETGLWGNLCADPKKPSLAQQERDVCPF